jgi:DNA-3-methyladenine glycosylase
MKLKSLLTNQKLTKEFYKQNVLEVARNLPGKIFVVKNRNQILAGVIVEVEAYSMLGDKASHSYNGKTVRNTSMFSGGGVLYVYSSYGIHFCANIVTGEINSGDAVLLRAIEPFYGVNQMVINRFGKENISNNQFKNLTNGPGKICSAFGIDKKNDGIDLSKNHIFIVENSELWDFELIESTRIGITKSTDLPWRFYIKNSQNILNK